MKKRYFVVGDIHAFYDEMQAALQEAGFCADDPAHVLVSLGDLLDRGDKPLACLDFVNALPADRKILIRGNHEDLLEECLAKRSIKMRDIRNGTMRTVMALAGEDEALFWHGDYKSCFERVERHPALTTYLSDLVDYAEVGRYLFVHGWFPACADPSAWRSGDWAEARWFNGMEQWALGARLADRTVVCGHFHTSWGHAVLENHGSETGSDADFSPFVHDGIIAIDACTALSHRVNCVVLDIDA